MSLLDTVRESWGWIGLEPAEIVQSNPFGNLIVLARDGSYWRICPEEWSCEQIALDSKAFAKLFHGDDFQVDWQMSILIKAARENLGPLSVGWCYCLKLPAVVGGTYDITNIGTVSLDELISFSGEMASKIEDVSDGETINFEISDSRQ